MCIRDRNYRSMINKFEKLMKDTESRLTSMKESSNMEVAAANRRQLWR